MSEFFLFGTLTFLLGCVVGAAAALWAEARKEEPYDPYA